MLQDCDSDVRAEIKILTLAHVLPDINEDQGFMAYLAAHHQGAIEVSVAALPCGAALVAVSGQNVRWINMSHSPKKCLNPACCWVQTITNHNSTSQRTGEQCVASFPSWCADLLWPNSTDSCYDMRYKKSALIRFDFYYSSKANVTWHIKPICSVYTPKTLFINSPRHVLSIFNAF